MPETHARLSCSSAHRWLHCTPSVRLEETFPDTGSEAAAEGTRAHTLAEAKLLGKVPLPPADDGEMDEATDAYRDYILDLLESVKDQYPEMEVEVKLDVSRWVPEGFGTADCIIITLDTLHIIDFKYGKGVAVDAHNNPQMRLYALGAYAAYWDTYEFKNVTMHIFQPRKDYAGSETMTVQDLLEWGEETKKTAQAAMEGKGETKPGSWCQFCRAKFQCRAKAAQAFKARADKNPELMDVQEMADCLAQADETIKWLNRLKDHCLNEAMAGVNIPGFKVVEGRSNRKITDPEGFAEKAIMEGYQAQNIWKPRELQTLTTLEKLIGKKTVAEEYDAFIHKPEGKPTLVPETDKRPVLDSFDNAFEILEEK